MENFTFTGGKTELKIHYLHELKINVSKRKFKALKQHIKHLASTFSM